MTELDDKWKKYFPDKEDSEQERKELEEEIEISYDEWYFKLKEKYHHLHDIVNKNLPNLWDSLEFELSIQKILNIKDCTLPFAGIVLGRPSSLKTVGIELFRKWKGSFYTDNFSPKAFVSHSTAVKREQLEQIDMLPKIKNKLFLTPELSPTFTKKDDDLIEILGILTRVLDGQGYESDTGAHGHRGYTGEYMFVWVGAAVDIPYKVHKYLGTLGPKLYFLRLPNSERGEDEYLDQINKDDFKFRTNKIQEELIDYLNWFELYPGAAMESKIAKISWNFEKDDENAKRFIIRHGILLAYLRGIIPTWETHDSQGIDYAYTFANVEEPDRAIRQLTNLARGHALSQGRNYITIEDVSLVIKVVFSTASMERVRIFELLLNFGGTLTTRQITDYLNTSSNTAKRTMAELKAIGLVNVETVQSEHGEPQKRMVLDEKFEWFLCKEFIELKQLAYRKNFTTLLVNNEDKEKGIRDKFSYGINLNYEQIVLSHIIADSSTSIHPSQMSHASQDYPPSCYYCHESFNGIRKGSYENHVLKKHQKMPCYPGLADIKKLSLVAKGMHWEI